MASVNDYKIVTNPDDDRDTGNSERSKAGKGDIFSVKVTRNEFADFFKKLEKKSKNMKQSLQHVAALIARYHFKHYTLEEGPDQDDGGDIKPWMDLDEMYKPKKDKRFRNKMLRNKDSEIFNKIKGGTKDEPPEGSTIFSKNSVEVGIISEKYAILHEGAFTRYVGDTRLAKMSHEQVDRNKLARRIIGLADSEKKDLFEDYELYFRKELEDL